MINKIVRLVGVKQFDVYYEELPLSSDKLVIRPEYLSICAADLRYYTGQRNREALKKKLPLSLIHEATGTVLYDPLGRLEAGSKVVMIPNTYSSESDFIKGNYQKNSCFRSSDIDGFMQDYVLCDYDRVIPLRKGEVDEIYVLSELISTSVNAVSNSILHMQGACRRIGIWGDGNLGFTTMITVRSLLPDAEIIIFGHNVRKSLNFIMADKVYNTENIPSDMELDCAFECVGGVNSVHAIRQSIELVRPQGCISLLGVSEEPVPIDTRQVLSKGLSLLGNSRSERCDFETAIGIIREHDEFKTYLGTIISERKKVKMISDIYYAFEHAQINDFKTIMKWEM
ncbi:MAG: alcohol dehydrogenase catalytic domain-containing protein [Lachnospiraceae bacterium]|nr:alcohol dehydrogenase catalytic domain-containing protein [Lachnospiraceae bacterium]